MHNSNQRRSKLTAVTFVSLLVGVAFLAGAFLSSMLPSKRANSVYDLDLQVSHLEPGVSLYATLGGKLRIIYRKSEEESRLDKEDYVVYNARAIFSDELDDPACVVYYVPNSQYSFFEFCRKTMWNLQGDVLGGSHPSALPLERVKFRIKNGVIRIVRDDI